MKFFFRCGIFPHCVVRKKGGLRQAAPIKKLPDECQAAFLCWGKSGYSAVFLRIDSNRGTSLMKHLSASEIPSPIFCRCRRRLWASRSGVPEWRVPSYAAYRNGRGYKRISDIKIERERSASGVGALRQAAAGFVRRLRDQSIISIKQLVKGGGASLRMYFRRRLLAFDWLIPRKRAIFREEPYFR